MGELPKELVEQAVDRADRLDSAEAEVRELRAELERLCVARDLLREQAHSSMDRVRFLTTQVQRLLAKLEVMNPGEEQSA